MKGGWGFSVVREWELDLYLLKVLILHVFYIALHSFKLDKRGIFNSVIRLF